MKNWNPQHCICQDLRLVTRRDNIQLLRPAVQKVDNAIHWIYRPPVDS